jgi:murein DD-endopeptidase MepM/ murein hydrolase activator NlpD
MASPDSDESYLEIISPGTQVSTDYKQPVTWEVPQLGDCPYCYQNGHGADGTTHAGMDIVSPGGYGAPVATPVSGRVICAGGGQGSSVEGWQCDYAIGCTFEDSCGAGQVTLDVGADAAGNQLLINMIHLSDSYVQDGQMVNPGDQIAAQGSMGGMVHTHMEALAICNGTYIYLDPTLVANGYYSSNDACAGY